jgi:hypothetical protein
MPHLDRLPTAEDGVEGLLKFAQAFGAEEAFLFFGYVRKGGEASQPPGQARAALAHQMVEQEMRRTSDYDEARRTVAERLGYTKTTRTNFYKLVEGTTRDGKPIADARH